MFKYKLRELYNFIANKKKDNLLLLHVLVQLPSRVKFILIGRVSFLDIIIVSSNCNDLSIPLY